MFFLRAWACLVAIMGFGWAIGVGESPTPKGSNGIHNLFAEVIKTFSAAVPRLVLSPAIPRGPSSKSDTPRACLPGEDVVTCWLAGVRS